MDLIVTSVHTPSNYGEDTAKRNNDVVNMEVLLCKEPLSQGEISSSYNISDNIIKLTTSISNAWKLAKHFDIHSDAQVRASELLRQQNIFPFVVSVLEKEPQQVAAHFWASKDLPDDLPYCIPSVTSVTIGEYHIMIAVAILGSPKLTGKIDDDNREFILEATDVVLCEEYFYKKDEKPRYSKDEMKDFVADKYTDTHYILPIDNL